MKRGWCPTLHEPMQTGDGLLVRVKPRGSRLSSEASRLLAASARAHGNGTIELTSRGNLQIRGLCAASVPDFAASMAASGLAHPDPAAERRRNVSLAPLASAGAARLAASIETMLEQETGLAGLPPKFCLSVDGGSAFGPARDADLTVVCAETRHWISACSWQAETRPDAIVAALRQIVLAAGSRRIREFAAEAGVGAVFGAAGLRASPCPYVSPGLLPGYHAHPDHPSGAFAIAIPFGQFDSDILKELADLADTFADGILRVSAFRAIVLAGIGRANVAALADAVEAAGLVANPADPRLRISACIGAAGCASATVRPRDDASHLLHHAMRGPIHLSGCSKGCAHSEAAPVTLVGEAGGYGIVLCGRAADKPVASGLSIEAAVAFLDQPARPAETAHPS
jgi:precorrin-3B synthase